MKLSDSYDARHVRPRRPGRWRWRFGAAIAALLATFGILLAMAGAATLLGRPPALGGLNDTPTDASILLALGLFLLWFGILAWRICRRRLRRPSDLTLAPHLLKKRG